MKIGNVLSLFNGYSGLQVALDREGIEYDNCFSSEIDKYANIITQKNYPDTMQIGDVHFVSGERLPKIDLLCGGSPCQDLSIAGKGKGLKGGRSALFWEYVRILKEAKPRWFILENVASMKQVDRDIITKAMGVEPIMINSALVSAQNRKRLYWTNIPVKQPEDQGVLLKDILEDLPDCPIGYKVREKSKCVRVGGRSSPFGAKQEWDSPFQRISKSGKIKPGIKKSCCLTAGGHSGGNHSDMDIIHTPFATRRYSVIEAERLMGLRDNYTKAEGVSDTQRYRMCGNGLSSGAIAHILRGICKCK